MSDEHTGKGSTWGNYRGYVYHLKCPSSSFFLLHLSSPRPRAIQRTTSIHRGSAVWRADSRTIQGYVCVCVRVHRQLSFLTFSVIGQSIAHCHPSGSSMIFVSHFTVWAAPRRLPSSVGQVCTPRDR